MDALLNYVFGGFGTVFAGLAVIGVVIGIDRLLGWFNGGGKG
jgi:hypothetical protein